MFAAYGKAYRDALHTETKSIRSAGRKIIGFLASARSSTLPYLNRIYSSTLACIADNNALRSGGLTLGTNGPIVPSEDAFRVSPVTVLLLVWKFEEAIIGETPKRHGWTGPVLVRLPDQPRLCRI
jgi:hypothetical protein